MTALNIKGFRGKIPRTSARLLNGNYAVEALNCKLTAGRIDPIKGPALVHTSMAPDIQSLYRYRNSDIDYWLVWGKQVDVAKSPTAQDARNRLFWTGDGEPRMAGSADAIQGIGPYPVGWFVLGVYPPAIAPTVGAPSGGQFSRSYVYTFVTQYGEESGPSPATIGTGADDGTAWNLSGMETPPPNAGTISLVQGMGAGVVRLTVDTTRGLSVHEEVVLTGNEWLDADLLGGVQKITAIVSPTQFEIRPAYSPIVDGGLAGTGTWVRRAPHNLTAMKRRIYRTIGTNTDYKLVGEIDATATTYADTVLGTRLGAGLTTLFSFPPPKDGHSLTPLANGSHAMLSGNQLCLSEQYKPYSYPVGNRYTFDGVGVALVAAGNSVIVLRESGKPRVYTATVPEAASGADLPTIAPCVSKRGVVDAGGYGIYPSHDGLYAVTPSDARNLTEKLFDLAEWRKLSPASFAAAYFDNTYYAVHAFSEGGSRTLQLDMNEPDSVRELDGGAGVIYANPLDGRLYYALGDKIYEHDADDANRYVASWRSGDFQMASPQKFNCAQVHAEFGDIVSPDMTVLLANRAIFGAGVFAIEGSFGTPFCTVPYAGTNLREVAPAAANRVQFSLVKDGQIMFTKEVNSSEPFRVPAEKRAEVYAVLIASSIPVYSVSVAPSMQELGRVSE